MEDSFAHIRVVNLIMSRGGRSITGIAIAGEEMVFLMPSGVTIRLPKAHDRIPESIVQQISEMKLEMSHIEYDYWLSNQDRPNG